MTLAMAMALALALAQAMALALAMARKSNTPLKKGENRKEKMKKNRLTKAREALNLTQREVSVRAGIWEATFSRIEIGRQACSGLLAEKIAKILRVEVDAIFTPIEKPTGYVVKK